jgi:flagellar motor switch protein FliN/FliY
MAETTGETQASEAGAGAPPPRNFDLLLDVPLEVTVEIGRARIAIRDLLQLGAGSVVELAKLAGEPLDVLINGRPIARGEAVMVNDKFGVRLTDVASPSERIAGLK